MDASGLLRTGSRRLLRDCTVVGSVGVGGSIAILLLIGMVVGAGASTLFFWWRQRRQLRIELEYRSRYGDAVKAGGPDVTAMVAAATTPTIARGGGFGSTQLAGAASLQRKGGSAMGEEGPLGMGAAASFKHDPLSASLKAHTNPVAGVARSSSGNPFSGEVSAFNVLSNEVCSLNNTPSPSGGRVSRGGSPDKRQGLISTAVFAPATDPASPRITKTAEAEAAAAAAPTPAAAASQQASPSSWPAPAPQHTRSVTVVTPACVAPGPAAAAAPRLPSSDYLAALDSAGTNPFDAPALRQQEEREHAAAVAAAQKAAQKQDLLQQAQGEEYGDDELDAEWAGLLGQVDARLQAAGRPRLSARERAVAIRSLIVATASQSVEAALSKAVADVETFRRASSFRTAP